MDAELRCEFCGRLFAAHSEGSSGPSAWRAKDTGSVVCSSPFCRMKHSQYRMECDAVMGAMRRMAGT